MSVQVLSYENRAKTEGRQIVDVAMGNADGFLYPEELTAKMQEKAFGINSISFSLFLIGTILFKYKYRFAESKGFKTSRSTDSWTK